MTAMKYRTSRPSAPSRGLLAVRAAMSIAVTALLANAPLALADSTRFGSDPLSAEEIAWVTETAGRSAMLKQNRSGSGAGFQHSGTPTVVKSGVSRVTLLVERRALPKTAPATARQADVYVYDYTDNSLHHTIVDVVSGQILREEQLYNVQLPLIDSEVALAAKILMGDPVRRKGVEAAYLRVSGTPLRTMEQIDFKAFVFHASTLRNDLVIDSAMCGTHRCAQLVMYTKDNVSLDYSPIVDLSRGVVTQVHGAQND